jgi:hypothetical protein
MATQTEPEALSQTAIAEVYRGIGRLEGQQEQSNARLDRIGVRLDRIEARLDRLIFAMFGMGAGLGGGVITVLVKLFLDG